MTDEQIVNGCVNKDPKAQKCLYDKFSGKMMGVCLRYCESEQEAEDVLQNGFIAVFMNIASFNNTGSFEGWIRKIIVNTALTNIRKNKKFKQNISLDNVEYMLSTPSQIGDSFSANDLLKVIQQLPQGSRTIFNLYAIEGYTHHEIAEMLNISEGTSKSQYSRARAYLQKVIPTDR